MLRGTYHITARLGIFQGCFRFHESNAIFTVVENEQSVALVHLLVLLKAHLSDVARSAQVHRSDVLLHLGIVASFGSGVVAKHAHQFPQAVSQNGDTHQAHHQAPSAQGLDIFFRYYWRTGITGGSFFCRCIFLIIQHFRCFLLIHFLFRCFLSTFLFFAFHISIYFIFVNDSYRHHFRKKKSNCSSHPTAISVGVIVR